MRFLLSLLIRIGLTILITLLVMIRIKQSNAFKDSFYAFVYENNFNFAEINALYQNRFGTSFPFKRWIDIQPVFKEKLTYSAIEPYLDGAKLSVEDNYIIPVIKSGLVVFIGEREGYGAVVVVEQVDGIECWYGNLETTNVKLYEYIEAGTVMGSVNKDLYLVFRENGKKLNYEDHL